MAAKQRRHEQNPQPRRQLQERLADRVAAAYPADDEQQRSEIHRILGPYHASLPPPHPAVPLGYNQSSFTYEDLAIANNFVPKNMLGQGGFGYVHKGVAVAMNNFAPENLLGQGGFEYVHKGVLPNGKELAVKSLKANNGQGNREFQHALSDRSLLLLTLGNGLWRVRWISEDVLLHCVVSVLLAHCVHQLLQGIQGQLHRYALLCPGRLD